MAFIGPKRLEEAVEEASKVFWVEVAKQFPEITVDALDHGTVIVLQWQMKEAVTRWIQMNLAAMEQPEEEVPVEQRRTRTNGRN